MLIYYKKPHKSAQNRWRLKISLYICTRKQASSTTGTEIAVRRWASFQQKRTRHFAKGLECKYTDFLAKLCESKQKIKTI